MENIEQCVEFENAEGQVVRGILHFSAKTNKQNISLICLNAGMNDMAGWHRLQVKTARHFARLGYDVLRFDDIGIGDSDGEIDSDSIVKIFTDIEYGLYKETADLAVEFSVAKFPQNKQVYLGFCGGGLTGILSAAENNKIDGIVCIGGPVTLSSDEYLYKQDPWVVNKNITNYKNKLFNYRAWFRLLTFRGDYKTIFVSIKKYIIHTFNGEYSQRKETFAIDSVKNLNKILFNAFKQVSKKKCPCLFFYADTDSATWEFKKYFYTYFEEQFVSDKYPYIFIEELNANHIFSSIDSQKSLNLHVENWLTDKF